MLKYALAINIKPVRISIVKIVLFIISIFRLVNHHLAFVVRGVFYGKAGTRLK